VTYFVAGRRRKSEHRISQTKNSVRQLCVCTRWFRIFCVTFLSTIWALELEAQNLFSDNFESAVNVSPYSIAQQQANNTLASDSDPGPAQSGIWFTYGGEADGGPGLFGVQVSSNVDPPAAVGTYQGSNVLRIFRSPTGPGSAACANFVQTQTGGKIRATWIQMLHPSGSYECMIHFSGIPNPASEGFENARLSLVIHGDGTTAYLQGGAWHAINGLSAMMNTWQTHQLDVDLDAQSWSWTIGGSSSGTIAGFGNTPGNTAASLTFRGGGANNDLFYIDTLQVVSLSKCIIVSSTPRDGEYAENLMPVVVKIQDGLNEGVPIKPDTNSFQLSINNVLVSPTVNVGSDLTTIQYLPSGGWPSESTNSVRLVFKDSQAPAQYITNDFKFSVLASLDRMFILGWYHAAGGESTAFDEMAAHGFNTIMDYELGWLAENGSSQVVQEQINGAFSRGLRIQFEFSNDLLLSTSGGNWARLDAQVNQFKNYPLASWQMSDEPEYSIPLDVFQAAIQRIRLLDTNHPLSAVFTTDYARYQPYLPSLDIAAVDHYPYLVGVPTPNLRAYTKSAQRLVQSLRQNQRPLFVIQAFDPTVDNEFANYVQPTSEQQRFLTFAPLTVNIKGLMYWTFYRNSPQTRASKVYPVTDRLVGLIPVLQSTNVLPAVSSSGDISSFGDGLPDLTYLVRQYRGSTYIIAANNLDSVRTVTLTIQGQWSSNTSINVLHENRTLTPQLNVPGSLTVTDSFGSYKVHLYEVVAAPPSVQIGYWRAEEFSVPVVLDTVLSPAEDGILSGRARRTNTVPNTSVPQTGAANTRALEFFGIDGDAVDIDSSGVLDVGSGDFTLEAWLNARTIPGDVAMITGKRISGLFGDKGYELIAQSVGNGFTISFNIRAGGPQATVSSGILNFGTWYHVGAIRSSGSGLSLYLNGGLVQHMADILVGSNLSSSQHLSIGGAIEGDGFFHRPFDGFIDEVRLTKSALLPTQFLNSPRNSPVLSFTRMGNQMSLSWAGIGFVLQASTNVANPAGWFDLPNGQNSPVMVSMTSTGQFYRLIGR
jgi:hypothetical protein